MIPEELSSGRENLPSIASCIPVFGDANDSVYQYLEPRVLIEKDSGQLQPSLLMAHVIRTDTQVPSHHPRPVSRMTVAWSFVWGFHRSISRLQIVRVC